MRTFRIKAAILTCALFSSITVAEEIKKTENLADDFYAYNYGGISLGSLNVNSTTGAQDFSFISMGLSGGRQMTPIFGIEGFFYSAVNEEKDEVSSDLLGQSVDASYHTWGILGTAKTTGKVYAKVRGGLANSTFRYSSDGYENKDADNFGFMYSLIAGTSIKNVLVELEYNSFPEVDDPLFDEESYTPTSIQLNFGFPL